MPYTFKRLDITVLQSKILKCSTLCKQNNGAPKLFTSSYLKVKTIEKLKSHHTWLISQAPLKKYTPFALQVTKNEGQPKRADHKLTYL